MVYQIIGARGSTNGLGHWKPNRPMNIKPVIKETVEEDGKQFYIDAAGKKYSCGAFDAMFGKPVQKVEKKKRKAKV